MLEQVIQFVQSDLPALDGVCIVRAHIRQGEIAPSRSGAARRCHALTDQNRDCAELDSLARISLILFSLVLSLCFSCSRIWNVFVATARE